MGSARVHVRSNDFSRYPRDWAQPSHALIAHVRSNDFSRVCVKKAIAFFTPPYQA
ncbi:hypothetical protein [Laspinema palackyanum]|uniref:hypothetical protein n=1 Tax=Laspinema palackyanum TaxID=3231601 RepID=UPI00349F8961